MPVLGRHDRVFPFAGLLDIGHLERSWVTIGRPVVSEIVRSILGGGGPAEVVKSRRLLKRLGRLDNRLTITKGPRAVPRVKAARCVEGGGLLKRLALLDYGLAVAKGPGAVPCVEVAGLVKLARRLVG